MWNSIAYDAQSQTVYIGTGSGIPWNRRVRSADQGDNLFIASIVALDGSTGAYKWHYQVSPGDTWDHDATMDIQLADIVIGGRLRRVLMQAPKNGFFYVLDRDNGQLISAEPYAKVTWASRIDLVTGRPIETPGARYPNGSMVEIWPSADGAHSWTPMAYNPKQQLVYIPVIAHGNRWSDDRQDAIDDTNAMTGSLVAWNPVTQKAAWRIPRPTYLNGGILATGGDLVFQGTVDGLFKAYGASTGDEVWTFDTQAPVISTPISYLVDGRQYITVLTGLGMGLASFAGASIPDIERYSIDPRSQARRVLTFALDGSAALPARSVTPPAVSDAGFQPDIAKSAAGRQTYARNCLVCHGVAVIGSSHAPDLRRSGVPLDAGAFVHIVRDGALIARGMPAFGELTQAQVDNLRQYIRTEAARLRARYERKLSRE